MHKQSPDMLCMSVSKILNFFLHLQTRIGGAEKREARESHSSEQKIIHFQSTTLSPIWSVERYANSGDPERKCRSTYRGEKDLKKILCLYVVGTINKKLFFQRSTTDVQVCQEIATKMSDFNKDFAALEKQLEDLYKQSLEEKQTYEANLTQLQIKNSELQRQVQTLDEQLKVFMEDEEVEDTIKKISELTGANVKADLKRDFLETECKKLEDKAVELKKELLKAETECSKILTELKTNDKTLRNRVKVMESRLESSVTLEDHQKLKKELENLTVKYRELTQDYKKLSEMNQMEMDLVQK